MRHHLKKLKILREYFRMLLARHGVSAIPAALASRFLFHFVVKPLLRHIHAAGYLGFGVEKYKSSRLEMAKGELQANLICTDKIHFSNSHLKTETGGCYVVMLSAGE